MNLLTSCVTHLLMMKTSTGFILLLSVGLAAAQSNYDKLFLAGGFIEAMSDTADCEIVDLGPSNVTCEDPADFPYASEGGSTFLADDDSPVVCGGRVGHNDLAECLKYDASSRTWSNFGTLSQGRAWMSQPVLVGNNEIWLSGGRVNGATDVDTSELVSIVDGSTRTAPGFQLPSPRAQHCAVQINSTMVFVAGGGHKDPNNGAYNLLNDAYLVDVSNPNLATWYILPDMTYYRGGHVCGFVDNSVIVVGNEILPEGSHDGYMMETFSFDTLSWTTGDQVQITAPAITNFEDSFLVIGGYFSDGTILHDSDDILQWDRSLQKMVLRPEKLALARDTMDAVMVPDEICTPTPA